PLRQDEPVGVGVVRIFRVEPHLGEKDSGREIRHRATRRRMAAGGLGRRLERVDAKTRRDVSERRDEGGTIERHGTADCNSPAASAYAAPANPRAGASPASVSRISSASAA